MHPSIWGSVTPGKLHGKEESFIHRTFLPGFEGPSSLHEFSQREEEKEACFEGQDGGRITPITEQRWKSTDHMNGDGLHCLPVVLPEGQCERNLSESFQGQLVFLRWNEIQELVTLESRLTEGLSIPDWALCSVCIIEYFPHLRQRPLQILNK